VSATRHFALQLEPERYELMSAPFYVFDLDRRDFFKILGAGVLVVSIFKPLAMSQESGGARTRNSESLPQEIGAWLHIGENGRVTVYTGKVEVGQNIRTSLTQAVAEELRVSLEQIDLVMGDTQLTPFDTGTFGSRTTPTMNLQLRKVSAAARDLLIRLAAEQWHMDQQNLTAENGKVVDRQSKRSAEYAALVRGQQLTQTLPAEDPLIAAPKWDVLGHSAAKINGRDFVTGKHRYPSDQKLPDTWHGKVLRPPSFGATLASVDLEKAEQMGAIALRDGNFVGVAAPTSALATAALAEIDAEWKEEWQPSSTELFDYLRKHTEVP
jgi:nicotinate dehydrogenase subunit B